jgi:WD40 repeat protein
VHYSAFFYHSLLTLLLAITAGANNIAKNTGGGASAPTIEGESTHRADAAGNSGPEPSLVCAHVLCGHNSPVTAISYATDLDIALSGSRSGLLCLHSVRKGNFIRSISHVVGAPVDLVLATSPGYLISHSWSNQNLHVFWINGQHRATVRTATRYAFLPYFSSEVVFDFNLTINNTIDFVVSS